MILPLILGTCAALAQVGVLPAFVGEPWAAPVPLCALVAAWAATRRPDETWTIAVAGALLLGVLSVERSGWFLLALLPTVGVAMILAAVSPRNQTFVARLGRATAAAASGAVGYASTLAFASGSSLALIEAGPRLAVAAIGTAAFAAVLVALLTPLRPRRAGLFA